MYEGMLLKLRCLQSQFIVVCIGEGDESLVVGLIPKGMTHHIHLLLETNEDLCIQLDTVDCSQLTNSMWIQIDTLPDLDQLGISL